MATLAAALVFIGAGLLPASASPVEITVSGQGSASQSPDMATLNVTITTNDDVAQSASSRNNVIYAKLLSGMKGLGVAASDVQTTYYNLNFVPRPPAVAGRPVELQPNTRYGYVVSRNAAVTLHDVKLVGKAVDSAVAAGISDVGGVDFGASSNRAIYTQALARAVRDAQLQAEAMASAAHLHIARVKTMLEGYSPVEPPRPLFRAQANANTYPVPTQIAPPNSISVQATVTITYEAQ